MDEFEMLSQAFQKAKANGDDERARKYAQLLTEMNQQPQPAQKSERGYGPVRSVLQGGTFGFSDEIGAGAGALMAKGSQLLGLTPDTGDSLGDIYSQMHRGLKEDRERYRRDYPIESTALEIGGGVTTGGIGGAKALGSQTLRNVPTWMKASGVGAVEGGIYGAGSADPGERLSGAGTGAAIGSVAAPLGGAALEAVLRGGAGVTRWAGRKLSDTPRRQALRAIRSTAEAEGINPDDAVALYDRLGPEATLADLGENFRALTRAAVDQVGGAKSKARTIMNKRQTGQQDRLMAAAEQAAGANADDFRGTLQRISEERSAKAGPLYEQALSESLEKTPDLKKLLSAPTLKWAMNKGARIAKDAGEWSGKMSLPQQMHYAKVALDQRWEQLYKSGQTQAARGVLKLKNRMLDYMDENLPGYQDARNLWAGDSQLLSSIETGQKLFRLKPDEIDDLVSKMGDSELEMFRLGAIKAIREKMDDTAMTHDMVKKLVGSRTMQRKLQHVFKDPEQLRQFVEQAGREAEFGRTRQVLTGGSPTAERLAGQSALGDMIQSEAVTAAAYGDPIMAGVALARNLLSKKEVSPELLDELAETLLQQGLSAREVRQVFAQPQVQQALGRGFDRVTRGSRGAVTPAIEAARQ